MVQPDFTTMSFGVTWADDDPWIVFCRACEELDRSGLGSIGQVHATLEWGGQMFRAICYIRHDRCEMIMGCFNPQAATFASRFALEFARKYGSSFVFGVKSDAEHTRYYFVTDAVNVEDVMRALHVERADVRTVSFAPPVDLAMYFVKDEKWCSSGLLNAIEFMEDRRLGATITSVYFSLRTGSGTRINSTHWNKYNYESVRRDMKGLIAADVRRIQEQAFAERRFDREKMDAKMRDGFMGQTPRAFGTSKDARKISTVKASSNARSNLFGRWRQNPKSGEEAERQAEAEAAGVPGTNAWWKNDEASADGEPVGLDEHDPDFEVDERLAGAFEGIRGIGGRVAALGGKPRQRRSGGRKKSKSRSRSRRGRRR